MVFRALCLVALLLPKTAFSLEKELFDLSLDELVQIKISVSTLQEETILDVPSSVSVFDRSDIEQLGVVTISELLNFVPGFQSYRGDSGNNSFYVSSRARRRGQNAREVLLLVNGMRFNESQNGGAFTGQNIPLDNIERVEVIRGPGGAIYGSNAFLGVVNVVTASDNSVVVSQGSSGDKRYFLQSNSSSGQHRLETSLWSRRRAGDKLTYFNPDLDTTFRGEDEYEDKGLQLNYGYKKWEVQTYYTEQTDYAGYVLGFPSLNDDERLITDNIHSQIQHRTMLNNNWHVENSILFNRVRIRARVSVSALPPLGLDAVLQSNEWMYSGILKSKNSNGSSWVLGAEYRINDTEKARQSSYGAVTNEVQIQSKSKENVMGFFAQNQQQINRSLRSIIGLRYDNYSQFGGQFSPRIGLTYRVDAKNTFKAIYGEAFRAPSRSETDLINNPVFVGNPDLKPEVSKTTELIWVHIGGRGYSQVSLFHTDIIDIIVDNNAMTLPQSWTNEGTSSSTGLEVEVNSRLNPNWKLRSAITYFFDRPSNSNSSESEFLFTGALTYEQKRYDVSLMFNHQSKKVDENSSISGKQTLAGFGLFDLHARYFTDKNIEFFTTIKNVLGKRYKTPAHQVDNTYGVEGFDRQVSIGMRLSFD